MPEDRVLFIVRFGEAGDGGCGDVIDCTPIRNIGGLANYPLWEDVAISGPANPGVNVALYAASDREAIEEARKRADAYGRERGHAHRVGA